MFADEAMTQGHFLNCESLLMATTGWPTNDPSPFSVVPHLQRSSSICCDRRQHIQSGGPARRPAG